MSLMFSFRFLVVDLYVNGASVDGVSRVWIFLVSFLFMLYIDG